MAYAFEMFRKLFFCFPSRNTMKCTYTSAFAFFTLFTVCVIEKASLSGAKCALCKFFEMVYDHIQIDLILNKDSFLCSRFKDSDNRFRDDTRR